MITILVKINAWPAKRKELVQTLSSIVEQLPNENGYLKASLYQNVEDDNELLMIEEWLTQEDADTHLASDIFTIIRGTGNLMIQPPEILLHTGEQQTPFRSQV